MRRVFSTIIPIREHRRSEMLASDGALELPVLLVGHSRFLCAALRLLCDNLTSTLKNNLVPRVPLPSYEGAAFVPVTQTREADR